MMAVSNAAILFVVVFTLWNGKGYCQMCPESVPLIGSVGNAVIPDGALTASSRYNNAVGPSASRLDTRGAWSAGQRNTATEWLQADLGANMLIQSITTQGRFNVQQWVTQYTLSYSNTSSSSSFEPLQGANGDDIAFTGNSDSDTQVSNLIETPFVARYVRLHPQLWTVWPSMRWEIMGCIAETAVPTPEVTESNDGAVDPPVTTASVATTMATTAQPSNQDSTSICLATTPRIATVTDSTITASSQFSGATAAKYFRFDTLAENGHMHHSSSVCQTTTPRIATVSDSAISASSQYSGATAAQWSRLDTLVENGHQGAWSAGRSNANQWIKVDLGASTIILSITTQGRVDLGASTIILSVTTQGRDRVSQWVASYSIQYSDDDQTFTTVLDDTGSDVVYTGNTDSDTHVTNTMATPFVARYVRLVPVTWRTWISLRWEVNGCLEPIVETTTTADTTTQPSSSTTQQTETTTRTMITTVQAETTTQRNDATTPQTTNAETTTTQNEEETTTPEEATTTTAPSSDGVLTTPDLANVLRCNATMSLIASMDDSTLRSSTSWSDGYDAVESRLDNSGAWASAVKNNAQWLQVDLGEESLVESVMTQGRYRVNQWVTSYTIGWSMSGFEFNHVTDANDNVIVFSANSDQSTHVTNELPEPIRARYIRLYPVSWNQWISMRWELIGCFLESDGTPDVREGSWWADCGVSKYVDAGSLDRAVRIVGGQDARPNEFPWQISVQYTPGGNYFYHFCGGVIIHPMWVLTAAHCVNGRNPDTVRAVIGDHELNRYHGVERMHTIERILVHELYGPPGAQYDHDIALMLLDHPITFSENVQPACEPEEIPYTGELTEISGWGALEYDTSRFPTALQWVELRVLSIAECNAAYQRLYPFWTPITSNMVCAGVEDYTGQDSCQGDSGGPMVVQAADGRFDLVGLVSWGYRCAGGAPGVYARVSQYKDWIRNHMLQYTPAFFS